MKLLLEAEILDADVDQLKEMGYDINYPFSVNITLDYGDKVVYGDGKINTDK